MNRPIQSRAVSDHLEIGAAFLVAGMHRSGTSALAKVLALLGAELPHTLMAPGADNPKGFWESAPIAELNDALLAELGSSWDDVLAFLLRRDELKNQTSALDRIAQTLATEFSLTGAIVVKEPRIALLLDAWIAATSRERFLPRILIPIRNPLEVAASLSARNGFSAGRSLLLWLTYFLAAERSSRKTPRVFVHYQDVLDDWRSALRRVEVSLDFRFPGWSPAAELQIDAFLSHEDRHQLSTLERLNARPDVVRWVKQAYDWALGAAAGEMPDPAVLDAIAEEFEASARVFAPVIAEQRAQITETAANRALFEQTVAERDQALADLRKNNHQMEALDRDVRERGARIAAFDGDLQALEAQVNALTVELNARTADLKLALNDLVGGTARIEVLEAELIVRSAHAGSIETQLEAQRARAAELEAGLAARDEQVETLEETRRALSSDLARRDATISDLQGELERAQHRADSSDRELESVKARARRQGADLRNRAIADQERDAQLRKLSQTEVSLREHILALEASARAVSDAAQSEGRQRRRFESLSERQADFIRRSVPLFRRVRRRLWRTPVSRPLSDAMEFLLLAPRVGVARAAKLISAANVLRASGTFDASYYLDRNWDVAAIGQDPVLHYLVTGAAEGRDPSAAFSSAAYTARYSDVARTRVNPLLHFVRHGRAEGRVTAPAVGLEEVAESKRPEVTHESARALVDPYTVRPDDSVGIEADRGAQFISRFDLQGASPDWAGAVAALNAYPAPEFDGDAPDVSVIVPVYGQLGFTLNCIDSLLRHRSDSSFEVVVVDDCSPDATREWIGRVRGVRLQARQENGGFIEACNQGASVVRGRWLVFLNNDTRVVDGWLDGLIKSFATLRDAEIVGSKLFYPDGSLQEAGGIIWRDGSAWNYGRADDPGRPEYCYAREVDYVSGASIAIAKSVWAEIGGFDERYRPAYGEDSDLCLKVRYARGKAVWMQPASRVIHYEGKSSGTDTTQGVKAYQVANAKKLYETWKSSLATHRSNADAPTLEKDRGVVKRALVIDAITPEPHKDAGSVTCLELMRALQGAGYKVTFLAEDNLLFLPQASGALQALGIEVLYWPYTESLESLVAQRGAEFDVVVAFRFAVASKHLTSIRRHCSNARVIFHCSDLHYLREEREAELTGDQARATAARQTKQRELSVINGVDATVVHSTFEHDMLLKDAPGAKVYVFPWILDPVGRQASFGERRDIAFLGGYKHAPNVDAVLYFAERIWPIIHSARPDIKFLVVGSECPPELRALHGRNNIQVVGFVEDLNAFFESVRLSVAPIRYGAGIKGKVAMSLAHGVPSIVTTCAAEGMGLVDGEAVIIRDAEGAFAEAVMAIYDDEPRWNAMSGRALAFVEETYGGALARRRVEELLALAGVAR